MAATAPASEEKGQKTASKPGEERRRGGEQGMLRHKILAISNDPAMRRSPKRLITVTKLLNGQVFGLQKYFPWGVTVYNMDISGYEEKVRALDVLTAYAELAGARGAVRDRMALVAEELIINGMYHAPVEPDGKPK